MGKPMIFLNALGKAEVVFEKDDKGRQVIRGLPLMRPGTWNGRTYTDDDLRALATNFAIAQAEDNFEPPLWPYHSYDSEGKPVKADSRDIQGYFSAVTFDDAAHLLLGDLVAVDEGLPRHIQSGKVKHLSAEIDPAYKSRGKSIGPTLVGAAGVGYPGVRGMPPWEMVINAQEFGHEEPPAEPAEPAAPIDPPAPPVTLAATNTGAPMRDTLLPPSCFLIVGARNDPSTWSLPYRDADTSSPMTDQWGRKQRHTKAGPISCGRIRAIAAALKGARGSTFTASDLDAAAIGKLKAAATACKIVSPVIEALTQEGGATHMAGIMDRIRALVGTTPSEEDVASLEAELAEALKPTTLAAVPDPPKPTTNAQAGDDKDTAIAQLQAKIEADNLKHDQAIAQLRQERHGEQITMLVDTLVKGAYVPPAAKARTVALYMALPTDQTVEVLVQSVDGGSEQKATLTMVELLTEVLKDRGPIVSTTPQGLTFNQADRLPTDKTAAELEAAGREAAEKRNPKTKGG